MRVAAQFCATCRRVFAVNPPGTPPWHPPPEAHAPQTREVDLPDGLEGLDLLQAAERAIWPESAPPAAPFVEPPVAAAAEPPATPPAAPPAPEPPAPLPPEPSAPAPTPSRAARRTAAASAPKPTMAAMAAVRMAALDRLHEPLRSLLLDAADRVIASGRYALGPETAALERELATTLGVPHAVAVSSGTDALTAALLALDLPSGARVGVPALSFFATAAAVVRAGMEPVFVDVRDATLTLDEEALPEALDALIPVHLHGRLWAPRRLVTVPIVEDACQAIGAYSVGFVGRAAALSFYPTKTVGGLGEGGAVLTRDRVVADRVRALRHHGQTEPHLHATVGGNFRMAEIEAAFLRVKLPGLAGWNETRTRNAMRLHEGLTGLPLRLPATQAVVHQYVVRTDRRDELKAFLAAEGIETAIHYPRPIHRQPPFDLPEGTCPVAEKACDEMLSLPVHESLTADELAAVIAAVRRFYA